MHYIGLSELRTNQKSRYQDKDRDGYGGGDGGGKRIA